MRCVYWVQWRFILSLAILSHRRVVAGRRAPAAVGPGTPRGGRPRLPARAALAGIVYVLRSGIPWRMLPKEFGCSGVTCWRRLRDW